MCDVLVLLVRSDTVTMHLVKILVEFLVDLSVPQITINKNSFKNPQRFPPEAKTKISPWRPNSDEIEVFSFHHAHFRGEKIHHAPVHGENSWCFFVTATFLSLSPFQPLAKA